MARQLAKAAGQEIVGLVSAPGLAEIQASVAAVNENPPNYEKAASGLWCTAWIQLHSRPPHSSGSI